ncbi:MAG: class I SAM-dependent methyltransferase [Paracoccaceae bacterium]|nr:class I SAM-dependent methyltransferase [Paracoccaceae bacterium]
MTISEKAIQARSDLAEIIGQRSDLGRLIETVLSVWPEHAVYLRQSFAQRSPALLDTSNTMAAAILRLAGDRATETAEDYRWLCAQIQEEELYFARNDTYRYASFEQTNAHVYSDDTFMRRYMHGLLFSHVLWFMHLSSLHFFAGRLSARLRGRDRVLEVGSGHGLMLFLALRDLGMSEAVAWDLSEVSLEQTREALALLGMADRAQLVVQDMHQAQPQDKPFDLVILSHLLEHLDDPVDALQRLKGVVAKGGFLFVNIPLNAPMPDHLILLRTPEEAMEIIEKGGFRVLEIASHTTQGIPLPKALRSKTAVTCSIIAEPV